MLLLLSFSQSTALDYCLLVFPKCYSSSGQQYKIICFHLTVYAKFYPFKIVSESHTEAITLRDASQKFAVAPNQQAAANFCLPSQ